MKKSILILVVLLTFSVSINAQETTSNPNNTEKEEGRNGRREHKKFERKAGQGLDKAVKEGKITQQEAEAIKADRKNLKEKVRAAKSDGNVTEEERNEIKNKRSELKTKVESNEYLKGKRDSLKQNRKKRN